MLNVVEKERERGREGGREEGGGREGGREGGRRETKSVQTFSSLEHKILVSVRPSTVPVGLLRSMTAASFFSPT